MRIINLSSGSDGNVTYLETEDAKILIDAGLSNGEITKRLDLIGVKPYEIDAIIISHEHLDHMKGVDIMSTKYNLPVYAHEKVWLGLDNKLARVSSLNRKSFADDFPVKSITVCPVEAPHDVPCYGFSFINNSKKVSIITDLGHTNDRILETISGSQLIYLESNYDRQMLLSGTKYPLSLKRRIDGPNGHLSNTESAQAVEALVKSGTKQIILSHLSKENNHPDIAYNSMCSYLATQDIVEGVDVRIDVASTRPGVFFNLK